ncbi:MAG: TonB-dependent receptor [Nitrospirae bacterium]|nr:TonB-dependent receptor [Nitrospirota bacterium]
MEGINIVRKGAIANDVVLRGMQKDNVNVLVDGVRIYGACPNRMDSPAFHIDFAEVDKIDIVKGPFDVFHAGSMGGILDVKTSAAPKGIGAELNVTAGSYGSVNSSASASYGGDGISGLAGYAFKRSGVPRDGNGDRITGIYPAADMNRYKDDKRDPGAYTIHTLWTKLGYDISPNTGTTIGYSYQDASDVIYPYLLMDAEYDRTHRVNWNIKSENVSPLVREVSAQVYYDMVTHLMDNRLRFMAVGAAPGYTMMTNANTATLGANVIGTFAAGDGAVKAGVDYYNRNWDAVNTLYNKVTKVYTVQPMVPDVFVDNVGLFAEYKAPLGQAVTLTAGVRGDLAYVNAEKLREDRIASLFYRYYPGGSFTNSRNFGEASGNVQLDYSPSDNLDLFLGLGRGVRMPDPQELYANLKRPTTNYIGNPELDPTKDNEADLGVKYHTDTWYVNAAAFVSRVNDYINVTNLPAPAGLPALPAAKSFENVDARFWGFELGSQVSLPSDFFLKGSLSYVDARNLSGDRPLSEIPPLKGTVAARYDNGSFFAELSENMSARQGKVDGDLNESPTGGWATTDIKAGVTRGRFTVFAGVNNVFDKQYFSHLSYQRDPFASGYAVPENGVNFYVTATYRH